MQSQYTGGYLQLFKHVRGLPRADAQLTWFGLLVVAIAVATTPLLASFAARLTGVPFEDVQGAMQSVPATALVLALAVFTIAFGYLLVGAAQGPGVLWILVALQYIYQIAVIGISGGRTWLHLLPVVLVVAVGALTPNNRRWAQIVIAIALASVAIRLSPLPAAWRSVWYLLWIPAGAAFVALYAALARRPWPSAMARLGLAMVATAIYIVAIARAGTPKALAEGFHIALNNGITLLELLWFLLGVSFVSGAISFGQFVKRSIGHLAPESVRLWVLLAGWAGLIVWLKFPLSANPGPARTLGIAALILAIVALAARWRVRGMTREWLAGWIVASIALLGVVQAYFSIDIADVITREAGVLSLAAFVYAILWEITGRIPDIPLATPRFARPSPLLLYLGVILLVGAAALFGLSANLKYFQELVILSQYRGALALWMVVGLRELLAAWPAFSTDARRRAVDAFLFGALLAVPAFLIRAAAGEEVGNTVAIAALLVSALVLAARWPEVRRPLPAAVVGAAAALGFAASMSSRVVVALLHPLLYMLSALGAPLALKQAADVIFAWENDIPWHATDQWLYYAVLPVLAVLINVAFAWLRVRTASRVTAETGA